MADNPTLPIVSSPGNNLSSYLAYIKKIDILTPLEEQQLALKWFEKDDKNAAQSLIIAHLRFVVYIARSYAGYGLPLSDLIQEGNVGLMKAVKRFDPHRGVRLVTFAVYWIRAEIHEYILQNWRIVKVATTRSQRKLFFNLRSNRQRLAWLNSDEIKAVANDLKVPEKDVREMEMRLGYQDKSFEASNDADDEDDSAPEHYVDDSSMNPAALVERGQWEEQLHQAITNAMSDLDPKSRHIVEARWLSPQKATLKELGESMGVSRERIRQLEAIAFSKVRQHLVKLKEQDYEPEIEQSEQTIKLAKLDN